MSAGRKQIAALRKEVAACQAAEAAVKGRLREGSGISPVLRRFSPRPGTSAWRGFTNCGASGSSGQQGATSRSRRRWPAHMESRVLELAEATRSVIENAALERGRLQDVWRPIASAI